MLRFGVSGAFLSKKLNGNAPFWYAYQTYYERKMNGNAPFQGAFSDIGGNSTQD